MLSTPVATLLLQTYCERKTMEVVVLNKVSQTEDRTDTLALISRRDQPPGLTTRSDQRESLGTSRKLSLAGL